MCFVPVYLTLIFTVWVILILCSNPRFCKLPANSDQTFTAFLNCCIWRSRESFIDCVIVPVYQAVHPTVHPPVHSPAHPPAHPTAHPPAHPPVHPPAHPPVHSLVHPFVHTPVHPAVLLEDFTK